MSEHRMIGLDIGTASVRAAEVTVVDGQVRLHNFGQATLPIGAVGGGEVLKPELVTAAIQQLWKDRKFSSRVVYLGVANQHVVVREIDLPWASPEDLVATLPWRAGDDLPYPVEQAVLDFVRLDDEATKGKTIRGLLVASSRATITSMVTCAENAGLKPTSVDLDSFALLRAVGRGRVVDATEKVDERRKPGPATEVLVDIGASVTNIVVHKGGVPQIVRIVLRGGNDITKLLCERLGISNAEAEDLKRRQGMDGDMSDVSNLVSLAVTPLLEEIGDSVDYYSSTRAGARIERVRTCGGGSLLRGLLEAMRHELGLHVERADPLWAVQALGKDVDPDELELFRYLAAVPIGLAPGDVVTAPTEAGTSTAKERAIAAYPDPVARVNLIPPEVLAARKVRAVRRRVLIALALIVVVAIAGNILYRIDSGAADAALQEELATVAALRASQARFAEVPATRAEGATLDTSLATLMVNDTAWDLNLGALATPELAGIELIGVNASVIDVGLAAAAGLNSSSPGSLDRSGAEQIGLLTVAGRAQTYDAVATWVDSLDEVEGFLVPYITGSRVVLGADEQIEFTVEITLSATVRTQRYELESAAAATTDEEPAEMTRTPARLWMGAGAAAGLLLALVAWLFVVSPQRSAAAATWLELENAEQQSNVLRASNSALESQLAHISDERAALAVKREALPQTNSLDQLVQAFSTAAGTSGVTLEEVTPLAPVEISAQLTPVAAVVEEAAAATTQGGESADVAAMDTAAADAAAAAARPMFYSVPITVRASGPLVDLKEFLRLVQSGQPRAILFSSLIMAPSEGATGLEEAAVMTAETQVFVSP